MKAGYDSKTAITFLMIGLGMGALLTLIIPLGRSKYIPITKNHQPAVPGLGRMSA
jgi:hypothetical protein